MGITGGLAACLLRKIRSCERFAFVWCRAGVLRASGCWLAGLGRLGVLLGGDQSSSEEAVEVCLDGISDHGCSEAGTMRLG